MNTLEHMQAAGHEQVTFFYDEKTGLKAIVAIHSTALGPALGGCRVWPYESEAAALNDVLRLSRAMTYKNSAMGLPLGGGKAVIIADSRADKTPELFEAFGRAVERLGGRYITAEDVGTEPDDMVAVRRHTRHVAGLPDTSGDPSPATAFGVYNGIRAALKHAFGDDDLRGRRVAVQGLGAVGMHLCRYLHEDGAELIVTDIAQKRIDQAVSEMNARAVGSDEIYDVECDVFAPCALGAVVNDATLPRFKAKVIAGSANNQLAEARHGDALKQRGILYAPDFIINGGGVINVADELQPGGYDRERAYAQVAKIGEKVARALRLADERGISTEAAAVTMAEERLRQEGVGA
ncbi:MAG: Glu/Leu/Phe/Val dehydrogenase [Deinococcales bacterium]|nr:Glu/Leu/Phe/Val dehydrogenase [Deinococcales bacterium]